LIVDIGNIINWKNRKSFIYKGLRFVSVRLTGLEPAQRELLDPKSSASTNSATGANAGAKLQHKIQNDKLSVGILHLEGSLFQVDGLFTVALGVLEVDVEELGYGEGHLLVVDLLATFDFAFGFHLIAESNHPCLACAGNFIAVAFPSGVVVAASVVASDDEGGLVLIEGVALGVFPQVFHEAVEAVGRVDIESVFAYVGKVVGLAEAHEGEHGVTGLHGFEGIAIGEDVISEGRPLAGYLARDVVIVFLCCRGVRVLGGIPSCIDGDSAAVLIEDFMEAVPRAEGEHFALIARVFVGCLKDAHVGVREGVVAVHVLVVGIARGGLVISGIGEVHAIGNVHEAAFVAVAIEDAHLRHFSPDEGEEGGAAFFRRGAPVELLLLGDVGDVFLVVQTDGVDAVEDFLPAQTVHHDEDDAVVVVFLCHRREAKRDQ
jgi:hypothetical protein